MYMRFGPSSKGMEGDSCKFLRRFGVVCLEDVLLYLKPKAVGQAIRNKFLGCKLQKWAKSVSSSRIYCDRKLRFLSLRLGHSVPLGQSLLSLEPGRDPCYTSCTMARQTK